MLFTFQALDDGFFVPKIPFYQHINISETGRDSDQQENDGKDMTGIEFPVQIAAQKEATKNRQNHCNADAAGISHLDA